MSLTKCHLSRALILTLGLSLTGPSVWAEEGGVPAYFLGSRDTFAGIVPGPGLYVAVDVITFSGDIPGVSIGGLPIAAVTNVDANLAKLSVTKVFDGQLWGGTPALNINIPILSAKIGFEAINPPLVGEKISDETSGVGDITITPMVGWHRGMLHYSAGMSFYVPTGSYSTATIDIPNRSIDALSNGKNVWTVQPVLALTHFNPKSGVEFSGAASFMFHEKNSATDYQTAPAFTLEATAMQHMKSGWAIGASGYWYQQLDDDSGTGATNTRAALGASSLKARVFGLGPIITYNDELFGKPVSFKMKYYKEFGAERKFENDVLWLNASMSF